MRSLSSIFAAASIAMMAAPAHADPSLPPGWIAGGPPSPMHAEMRHSRRSREALQLSRAPLAPALAPVSLSLDAFDVVDVAAPLTHEEVAASNAPVAGEIATDFFVDRTCSRASVSGHVVGDIQVGGVSLPIGAQSSGGVFLWHVRGSTGDGDGQHRYARAVWETIERQPDGTLRYTQTMGRFDVRRCKTTVHRRYTAVARPILGGLAFVFRTRCAACGPSGREELHVITPSGGWGNSEYGHSTVNLAAEGGDSERWHVSQHRIRQFAKVIGRSLPELGEGRDLLLGIEAAKGLGEAASSVIAYATEVKQHRGF